MREEIVVKRAIAIAVLLGCGLAAGVAARAQNANPPAANQAGAKGQQKQPAAAQQTTQQPASSSQSTTGQSGSGANPFPEDESTVPVLPAKNVPEVPEGNAGGGLNLGTLFPAGDMDPVQSPDNAAGEEGPQPGFSSSDSGIDSLLPPPGASTDTSGKRGKGGDDDLAPVPQESAAEDENVGKYYLDNKDWRAALSRYESALVLDPDNPDVYWGLAESQRHLGQFADARANYLKVMEYDPGSRHAKDAKKALEEPELANAKPAQGPAANARQ
ncbi:MAG TPA: tetratricopeptide repeat protein [Terracidiphilus sp.]|nr:tetratricopeptide repeat protein [Terracidiphilus sp.]